MTHAETIPDMPDGALPGTYSGQTGDLFRLALKCSLLTIVTLGLYRFWAKTRIRRYVWSSLAPGGDPFEYTGTGKEKFLGFLIAVVVLGIGLGLLQLALTFVGLSLIDWEVDVATGAFHIASGNAFALMAPIWFFAMYRARRYRMSRTTWRGIRFGMLPGSWGYVWRGCAYGFLSVLTVGLLLPLMTFKLEEYMTNRTYYGDARMHQGGRWQMLYPAMKVFAGGVGIVLGAILLALAAHPAFGFFMFIGWIVFLIGFIHYRVQSFAILTRHKVLNEDIALGAAPQTRGVAVPVIIGWIGIGILFSILMGIATSIAGAALLQQLGDLGVGMDAAALMQVGWVYGVAFLIVLALLEPLKMVWINQPAFAHIATHTWIVDPIRLTSVRQRSTDDFADADGFADALDVGSVF